MNLQSLNTLNDSNHGNHIEIEIITISDKLQHGYIFLGKATTKGVVDNCFMYYHKTINNPPLCISGRQGAGKAIFL